MAWAILGIHIVRTLSLVCVCVYSNDMLCNQSVDIRVRALIMSVQYDPPLTLPPAHPRSTSIQLESTRCPVTKVSINYLYIYILYNI